MFEKVTNPTKSGSFDDPGLESPEKLRKKIAYTDFKQLIFSHISVRNLLVSGMMSSFSAKTPPHPKPPKFVVFEKKTSMNVYGSSPGKFDPQEKMDL